MKRFISVFLRIFVILLAMSFNIVENILHQVSTLTYSLTAEFTITVLLIIVTGALFASSIIKFKLKGKPEKIIMIAVIAVALTSVYLLMGFVYGIMYAAVFVCAGYIIDLIFNK